MPSWILILFALIAGSLLALQAPINAQLGRILDSAVFASFISFAVGTFVLFFVLLAKNEVSIYSIFSLRNVPVSLFIGGVLGAVYVTGTIWLVPQIGVANTLIAIVAGQVLLSLLLDQLGLFGLPVRSITPLRITGAIFVLSGISIILYGR